MATDRRKQLLLGALIAVLVVVGYRSLATSTSGGASTPSNPRRPAAQTRDPRNPAPSAASPDVHLNALNDSRPKPAQMERNLFRFRPKAAPAAPLTVAPPSQRTPAEQAAPPVPTGPPPPPPITLKFIGVVDPGAGKPKIAVLSDSAGHVFRGTENGPPIEGRYRILRIGTESIEMAYLDGRGRQTIRLTGS